MGEETIDSAGPKLRAYAGERGLFYYENWSIPEATQLLHHGDIGDAPCVLIGDLPGGLADSWLALFRSGEIGGRDRRIYTVVVARAPASVGYAVRLLCHDRDLASDDATNPDAERQTVELDDRLIEVESEAFVKRYRLLVDHDQDQVRAWQLFDPALIAWLTDDAPEGLSFELQAGALCAFVPGAVADAARLDALCGAAARIHGRVAEIEPVSAEEPPGDDTREGRIERELAAHPFSEPPSSARAAGRRFGLFSRSAKRLGAEAFFRAQARAMGLEPMAPAKFLGAHIDLTVPGSVTQVARGRLPGTDLDGYLVGTTDTESQRAGWMVAAADIAREDNGFAFALLPEFDEAEKEGLDVSSNGSVIVIWKPDGGPYSRTARELGEFATAAFPLLERAVAAAKGRP